MASSHREIHREKSGDFTGDFTMKPYIVKYIVKTCAFSLPISRWRSLHRIIRRDITVQTAMEDGSCCAFTYIYGGIALLFCGGGK
jgi:hypothetical protein